MLCHLSAQVHLDIRLKHLVGRDVEDILWRLHNLLGQLMIDVALYD